mmetsp:Transcript_77171/g.213321  ORF Transcript_77171/g.213321 Transcript_77171/m.213321 type:complete len:209 (+) Transcript_77171:57-683(+)
MTTVDTNQPAMRRAIAARRLPVLQRLNATGAATCRWWSAALLCSTAASVAQKSGLPYLLWPSRQRCRSPSASMPQSARSRQSWKSRLRSAMGSGTSCGTTLALRRPSGRARRSGRTLRTLARWWLRPPRAATAPRWSGPWSRPARRACRPPPSSCETRLPGSGKKRTWRPSGAALHGPSGRKTAWTCSFGATRLPRRGSAYPARWTPR